MNRILFTVIALIMFSGSPRAIQAKPLEVKVEASAAILMNAETGAILYEKNAHATHYPASTTKVATALYALHLKGDKLDAVVTAGQNALTTTTSEAKRKAKYKLPAFWLESDGSHIGLKVGEQVLFKDLIHGMMLVSGNDAANTIASYAGDGSIPKFIDGLNQYLQRLGCRETHFANPSGLFHPEHHTCAHDMALLTKEAMKNPFFRQVVSTVSYNCPETNMQPVRNWRQGNHLLTPGKFHYAKAIGVKTGYTVKAQNCFVSAAQSDGRTLIAVVLQVEPRALMFKDAVTLFDAAFAQPKLRKTFIQAGKQTFTTPVKGAAEPLLTYTTEEAAIDYYPAEEQEIKCTLHWGDLKLPIRKGQEVAKLQLAAVNGAVFRVLPIYAQQEVKATWAFWFSERFTGSESSSSIVGALLLAAAVVVIVRLTKRRHHREA